MDEYQDTYSDDNDIIEPTIAENQAAFEKNPLTEAFGGVKDAYKPFDLSEYVANEVGLPDGRFTTDVGGEKIEKHISELNEPQLVNLLKESIIQKFKGETLSDDEKTVVGLLREGKENEIYEALKAQFEQPDYDDSSFTDEDYVTWKLLKDYPHLNQLSNEDLLEQVEQFKDSGDFTQKLDSIKSEYNATVEAVNQKRQQEQYEQFQKDYEKEVEYFGNSIANLESVLGYEMDIEDDVKEEAFEMLTQFTDEDSTETIFAQKFLNNPQGLTELAVLAAQMPKIYNYVQSLEAEIEELKSSNNNKNKNLFDLKQPQSKQKEEDEEDTIQF